MQNRNALILLFVVAVSLRFAAAVALRDISAGPDPRTTGADGVEYDSLGARVAAGAGYTTPSQRPTSFRPPGFPFFLALLHSVAPGWYPLCYLAFAVLGGSACVAAYLLGCELLPGSGRGAWAAAWLCVFYPPHVYFSTRFDSEILFAPLLGFALWLFVRAVGGAGGPTLVLCGLLFGAATLTRSFAILLAPLLAALFVAARARARRPWLAPLTVFAASWVVVVIPWTARNYAVHGRVVLVNTNGGSTFYGANNSIVDSDPDRRGSWVSTTILPGRAEIEAAPDEVTHDAVEWRLGWAWLRNHPDRILPILWHKFVRFCSPDTESANRKYVLLQVVGATPFLELIGVGMLISGFRRTCWTAGWGALHLTMAATVATALLFWGSPRFRDANAVPMMVYAALALNGLPVPAPGALTRRAERVEPALEASQNRG